MLFKLFRYYCLACLWITICGISAMCLATAVALIYKFPIQALYSIPAVMLAIGLVGCGALGNDI